MRSTLLIPLVAAPLLALLSGCSDEGCSTAADCAAGFTCRAGTCVHADDGTGGCTRDEDCAPGLVCQGTTGQCLQPGGIQGDIGTGGNEEPKDAGNPDADAADDGEQPRVLEVTPADGTRDVQVDANFAIVVKFSHPMSKTRVEAGLFLTEIGTGNVSLAITYDEGNRTARAVPTRDPGVPEGTPLLKPYGVYQLRVSNEIRSDTDPPRNLQESVTFFSVGADPAHEAKLLGIAREYAPNIYQDAETLAQVLREFITKVDFDGDWNVIGAHRAAQGGADLVATVYYSVVESETHKFITYAFFHPSDTNTNNAQVQRENSMKGATVVTDKAGALVSIHTYSRQGNKLEDFVPEGSALELEGGQGQRSLTEMPANWLEGGKRYSAYMTMGFHHSCIWQQDRSGFEPFCRHDAGQFNGGFGVKYVAAQQGQVGVKPDMREEGQCNGCDWGEQCRGGICRPTHYDLVPLSGTLWIRRVGFESETLWNTGSVFNYVPPQGRPGDGVRLPGRFAGEEGAEPGSGEPPWAWHDPEAPVIPKGAWFLDPAWAVKKRMKLPEGTAWSEAYCWNPFLGIDRRAEATCR